MSKTQTNAERIAAIRRESEEAAERWIDEVQAEGGIERRVRDLLDHRVTEVVSKLLGFNDGWGEWELDHCNGRSGESAAGDWLRARAKDAVTAWLDTQAGELPPLPKSAVADLRSEYLATLRRLAADQLRRNAQADAIALVSGIVADAADGVA